MADSGNKSNIECYVTFPNPSVSNESCTEHEHRRQGRSVKEPVVLLLGWAGCKDRNLAKYSAIYENSGCITIRYTAPNKDIFFGGGRLLCTAEKILQLVVNLKLDANPVFVHCFSNGGGLIYRWIAHLVHNCPNLKHINLVGTVFDSCPGKRNIFNGLKVLMLTTNHYTFIRYFLGFAFICYVIFETLVSLLSRPFCSGKSDLNYWNAMQNDPLRCPKLYLYSTADNIIKSKDVESQIEASKRNGIEVRSICWEDSEHVSHLLKHRESYIKSVLDFVSYCLDQQTMATPSH